MNSCRDVCRHSKTFHVWCIREMVVAESIRLYPPAWAIGRRSLVEQKIGDYLVPADAIVLLSPFVTHRDARFFPDPARFDPERWTPEAKESRSQYSYFPFGGGPRRCVGEGFAWAEGILVLATLASRWRARLVAGQKVEPKALITLRPKHDIRMTMSDDRATAIRYSGRVRDGAAVFDTAHDDDDGQHQHNLNDTETGCGSPSSRH